MFQFLRYAYHLHAAGAHVTVQTPKRLIPLLSLCPYIDALIPLNHTINTNYDYTFHISVPHLALTMHKTLQAPSKDVPYLYANTMLTEQWSKKLASDSGFKIGLCWHSSMGYDPSKGLIPTERTIPLYHFEKLGTLPNCSFYSLQTQHGTEEVTTCNLSIKTFNSDFDHTSGAFMDTAAVMKNLDLVITADTSVAHLAGALGIPVWVLLPIKSDFRWFLNRSDSPWYPTMRLFRQQWYNNWETAINEIKSALQKHITYV